MNHLDPSQRSIIDSSERRLFIEAPAGYGKTKVMVEKLASDLASNKIPYPKRALALTFSVNAARKMKNDIGDALTGVKSKDGDLKNRVDVSNYHALSRRIIMRHGYASLALKVDVNTLISMNESHVLSYLQSKKISFSISENRILTSLSSAVKQADKKSVEESFDAYCDLVLDKLIPNGRITYNAILLLAIRILKDDENVCRLYRSLYSYVIVDEAQDTNLLGYDLLSRLTDEQTRICMFGDSLQRIYGFIGAIPDFVETARNDFGLSVMELKTSHRFTVGSSMQLLDGNIRENIRNPLKPVIGDKAKIPLLFSGSIESEIEHTCCLASVIHKNQSSAKIAVLVRSRGNYSDRIAGAIRSKGISCFNGLFSDQDDEFIRFNKLCLDVFDRLTNKVHEVNFALLDRFVNNVQPLIERESFAYGDSFIQLIQALNAQIRAEHAGMPSDDKYQYVRSVFENRSIRYAISYIDVDVVVMTMHSSKRLEWDYVLLPEMMQWVTPDSRTCADCCIKHRGNTIIGSRCSLSTSRLPESYIDELCLFYVALTRAKRLAILFATSDRVNRDGDHKRGFLTCFAFLPGIETFSPKSLTDVIIAEQGSDN